MLEYRCAGCGRVIQTSDDMQDKQEPCPYCGEQNRVGKEASAPKGAAELRSSAKGSAVCAVLSYLWVPLLFLSAVLLPVAAALAVVALALAGKVRREAAPGEPAAEGARKLAELSRRVSIASLGLLAAVLVLLWATGYRPWSFRPQPAPVPGPEGPPVRTRPAAQTQKWTISRNSSMRRSTSSREAAASLFSEKSSSSMLATTVP